MGWPGFASDKRLNLPWPYHTPIVLNRGAYVKSVVLVGEAH